MVYLLAQVVLVVASPTKLIATATSQLSNAVTDAVFCAGTALAHNTVTGFGQVTVGG